MAVYRNWWRSLPIPLKLLICQFAWVVPYLCMANYLERSLLPFRLLCYTEADLLSVRGSNKPTLEACVRHIFPNRQADPECRLNRSVAAIVEPILPEEFRQVIVIRSAPASLDYREYIRQTWKRTVNPNIPVVFVVGLGPHDVVPEAEESEDILQLDFVDSYKNLTLKMMASYGYFLQFPSVEQIFVINDDTIVNSTALIIDSEATHDLENYIIGKVSRGYPRLFMPWLQWHVPGSMYKHKCYPPFVQGSSFIISRIAAAQILRHVCDFPFIHLDDVMMGIMTHCLGTQLIHREGFDRHVLDKFSVFHYQYSRHSASEMRVLWDRIKNEL